MAATERSKRHAVLAVARVAAVSVIALVVAGVALPQILDSGSVPTPSLQPRSGDGASPPSTASGPIEKFVVPSLPKKQPRQHRPATHTKPVSHRPTVHSSTRHTTRVSRPVRHSSGGGNRPRPTPTPTPTPTATPTPPPPTTQPTVGTAGQSDEGKHVPPGQAKKANGSPPYGHAWGYYKHHNPPGQAKRSQGARSDDSEDNDDQGENSHDGDGGHSHGNEGNGHSHGNERNDHSHGNGGNGHSNGKGHKH